MTVKTQPVSDAPTTKEQRDDAQLHETMREYFASQKKVSIKTREDETVQINGYTFMIKGGERVDVPEDVATILEESGRI